MMDLIDRGAAIDAFNTGLNELVVDGEENAKTVENYLNRVIEKIKCLPPAVDVPDINVGELISRQQAIDAINEYMVGKRCDTDGTMMASLINKLVIKQLPSVQLATDTNVGTKLGTNLAEVGTDCISKQQAIDALRGYLVEKRCPDDGTLTCRLIENEVINKLPPAQPDLSEYSDKLWQKAYERGKAEAQAEIVRCKDCRFNTYSKKCLNPDSFFLVPADDFYCGYAERRTDE